MTTKRIIFTIKFNTTDFDEFKSVSRIGKFFQEYQPEVRFSEQWMAERIPIFMKYTLPSLKAQTNQQFTALFVYEDSTEDIIHNLFAQHPPLPANVRLVKQSSYQQLVQQLVQNSDYTYSVNLDSDDMYHSSFVQQLYDYKDSHNTIALLCRCGYVYDSTQKLLSTAKYDLPSFYTIIYKSEDLLQGDKFRRLWRDFLFKQWPKLKIMRERNFIYVIHQSNTVHDFQLNQILSEKETKRVLRQFMGN